MPNRRAVASLALVTVLSAIEKQRKAKANRERESDFAAEDMSGELQTIPARHGVATFVPRGRTIKIINTYGKQVVSTWAFGLGAPPEEGDNDEDEEEIEEKVDELKEELRKSQEEGKEDTKAGTSDEDKIKQAKEGPNKVESDNSGESKQENQPGEKPGNAEERYVTLLLSPLQSDCLS